MKKCPNYPGYLIDETGVVFSLLSKKQMKSCVNNWGYQDVNLAINKKQKKALIHRMVADAFLEKPLMATEINHKNGIKTDNRVENLEWVTASQNRLHSHRVLKNKHGWRPKLSRDSVECIKFWCGAFGSGVILARIFNVTPSTISNIRSGRSWESL